MDPNQASKLYHDPITLGLDEEHAGRTVDDSDPFRQCGTTNADGNSCNNTKTNRVMHSVLSCLYQDEADGQVYRVVHRSMQHNYTNMMQRNVCGGHTLVYDASQMTYAPQQVNAAGEQLYVNPTTILEVRPAGRVGD